MIRLVAVDLDGTIVNGDGHCSAAVVKEIDRIRRMGICFAICSGRPIESVRPLLDGWGLTDRPDYIIGSNGGEVEEIKTGKYAVTYTLDAEILKEIIDLYEPLGLIPTLYGKDVLYVEKDTPETRYVAQRLRVRMEVRDIRSITKQPEMKEMFVLNPSLMPAAEAFAKAHPDPRYIAFKTAADLFEFNHPLLAKDVGLRVVASMMHIAPEEILAFGDTTNDIEMLKYAGHGICMGNGTEDAKNAADDICASIQHDGVAEYLKAHLITEELI